MTTQATRPPPPTAPPDAAAPVRPARRARRTRWWQHLLDAVLVSTVTALLVTVVYRLWDADPRIPLTYPRPDTDLFAAGDATFHQAVVTALLQGHWWMTNPQLGAPFGQELYDFPLGPDHLHVVLLAGLARLTGDPFLTVNLYFLGGYVVIALVAWVVARHLRLSRVSAVVVGVLFAFTPFHQGQGEAHLFLAMYVAVPLGALLLNWQLTGFADWGPGRRPGSRGLTPWRLLAVLLVGVVVGSGSAYFAFFALVLLALTAAAQVVVRRSARPLASALLLGAVPSAVLLANLVPAIAYQQEHGANLTIARPVLDSWFFGLDLVQLFAPIEDHRIDLLARFGQEVPQAVGWTEPGNSLGGIAALGLVALALHVAWRLSRRTGPRSPGGRFRDHQAAFALLALAVSVTGGLAVFIALGGLVQVRVWARMAVFLAFFALCAVGSWFDDFFRWRLRTPQRRALGRAVRWLVASVLVLVGVFDQTSSAGYSTADYRATKAAFESDAQFGADATRLLGEGSSVFQLPVVRFPEGGLRLQGMYDYDLLKGYLHAPDLRWSYGSVKGRPEADWQVPLGKADPADLLVEVAAAGFAGLYVDTAGYPEDDDPAAEFARLLDAEPLRSPDGRLLLFDLRPLHDRLAGTFGDRVVDAVGSDVTSPLWPTFGPGFYAQEPGSWILPRWSRASSSLVLDNPTSEVRQVDLGFSVTSVSEDGRLRVSGGGATTSVPLATTPGPVSLALQLPPGRTTVELSTSVPPAAEPDPDRPDARFVVSDLAVVSEERTVLLAACRPASETAPLGC